MFRTSGMRDEAFSSHDSSGTQRETVRSGNHARGVLRCVLWNGVVSDLARSFTYTFVKNLELLFYCFNLSLMSARAAHRGSPCCTLQSHSTRFLFWPHCGHSPLQSALHRLCMGTARKICSFSTSSSSMPSPL